MGRHSDGIDPEILTESPVPAMPVIRPNERYLGTPHPLVDGSAQMIGWQWRTDARGGPCFVTIRRSPMGGLKE